jgi:hypothetical protein
MIFGVKHYERVQIFFSHNIGVIGIKRRRIKRIFQNSELTLVTKAPKKSYSRERISYIHGPALCSVEIRF